MSVSFNCIQYSVQNSARHPGYRAQHPGYWGLLGINDGLVGRHLPITCNLSQVHDFIEVSVLVISHENIDFKVLYEKGHSLKEISRFLGTPLTTVRSQLARMGVTFRPSTA